MKRVVGIIGFPTVFIAAGWILLWSLWPSGVSTLPAAVRPQFRSRVAYARMGGDKDAILYLNPTRFARAVWSGLGSEPDETEEVKDFKTGKAEAQPRLLNRVPNTKEDGARWAAYCAENGQERAGRGFVPLWTDLRSFVTRGGDGGGLSVDLSPQLAECGFESPGLTDEILGDGDISGQVIMYVEFNASGRPENVLIEKGTPDIDLNNRIVRAVYRGRALNAGMASEGRLTVSFSSRDMAVAKSRTKKTELE